jgi:hypothetical protein
MKRILALAAVAVALPSTAFAQSVPAPASTAAPAVVAQREHHHRDGGYEHKKKLAVGCDNLENLSSRGTVTYSSCAVPKNHTLIEAGYSNFSVNKYGHAATYPNSIIRIGTSVQGLELDYVPPTFERVSPAFGQRTGVTDMGGGLTYQLPTGTSAFRATVNGTVYAPTADPYFGSRTGSNYQYGLNLGTTLGTFSINGTVGFQSTIDPLTLMRFQSFVPSLSLADQLGFGSRPGALFVEAARYSRIDPFGNPEMLYTAGYKQPVADRASLDAEYSTSPNVLGERAHSVGAGFSYLF